MKKNLITFFQLLVVLIGVSALVFLLAEPISEGVNANATSFSQIYLDDPFLAYVYLVSILFFVGLYQVWRLLNHMKKGALFSQAGLKAVRIIKYCSVIMMGGIVGAGAWVRVAAIKGNDDPAGFLALCICGIILSAIVLLVSMKLERRLKESITTFRL